MYIFDEEKNEVIPFTRPPSPPRLTMKLIERVYCTT